MNLIIRDQDKVQLQNKLEIDGEIAKIARLWTQRNHGLPTSTGTACRGKTISIVRKIRDVLVNFDLITRNCFL